jgi:hypothetical protein
MIVNLFKFIEREKVWLTEIFNMGNLLLIMMKVINLCIMRIRHHNLRFLVELILKYGRFWKWVFLKENRIKV